MKKLLILAGIFFIITIVVASITENMDKDSEENCHFENVCKHSRDYTDLEIGECYEVGVKLENLTFIGCGRFIECIRDCPHKDSPEGCKIGECWEKEDCRILTDVDDYSICNDDYKEKTIDMEFEFDWCKQEKRCGG